MPDPGLTKTRFAEGVWEGVLHLPGRAEPPVIEAVHHAMPAPGRAGETRALPAPVLTAADGLGTWHLRLDVPASVLGEGVQTVVLREAGAEATLAVFSILADSPPHGDVLAELAHLRAELELLKTAFRRAERGRQTR
ncbi:hypothetical protein C2I36_06035 [Rhodobacteraceae bacterium WD3A24]|nr:hypothetical protein C2I36_06035 [Rhodobacteraceae bacterium WD3A24]